jgi:hypothetical protein
MTFIILTILAILIIIGLLYLVTIAIAEYGNSKTIVEDLLGDDTVPFNPNNKEHTKALADWVKRANEAYKSDIEGIIMEKDDYNELRDKIILTPSEDLIGKTKK